MPVYVSQYPPVQNDTYVKATTKLTTNYWQFYTTDPAKSLIGTASLNSWRTTSTYVGNRFHIDLGSAKIIKRIYYENYHNWGGVTNTGVRNITFWGSNIGVGSFDDLVYNNDEGWTELNVSQNTFDRHSEFDQVDPKYIIVTNTTAYRYYAVKCADNWGGTGTKGVRRIVLQIEEAEPSIKGNAIILGNNF